MIKPCFLSLSSLCSVIYMTLLASEFLDINPNTSQVSPDPIFPFHSRIHSAAQIL